MQNLPTAPAFPLPFASNPDDRNTGEIPKTGNDVINWTNGFPEIFQKLIKDGGKYVQRKDMNTILYALSNEACYQQQGGVTTWSSTLSNLIDGYPQYARVWWHDGVEWNIIESLVGNNKIEPTSSTVDVKTDASGNPSESGTVKWQRVLLMQPVKCLPINGGTMSGDLILNRNPVSAMQAATKQYVDRSAVVKIVSELPQTLEVNTVYGVIGEFEQSTNSNRIASWHVTASDFLYTTPGTFSINIRAGSWRVSCIGGGGAAGSVLAQNYVHQGGGGSGAFVQGVLTSSSDMILSLTVGDVASVSSVSYSGDMIMKAASGTSATSAGSWPYMTAGVGGAVADCIASSAMFASIVKTAGNNGTTGITCNGGSYANANFPYGGGQGAGWAWWEGSNYSPHTGAVRITRIS